MMHDAPNPVIYIGQGACALAHAIHNLNKKFSFADIPCLLMDEDVEVVRPDARRHSPMKLRHEAMTKFHLSRCSHSVLEGVASCQVCAEKTQDAFKAVKQFCEHRDYATCVNIVVDFHTAFGCWMYDQVMEYLELDGFAAAINTVLLKPPLRISFIDNIYATYTSAMALEQSKQVLVRGIDEYLSIPDLLSNEKNNVSFDSEDLLHIVACDLWPAFACHDGLFFEQSQYHLWPSHLCRSSSKLFDIRTSLFKTLQKVDRHKKRGGTSNLDINPNRILASNVHHLHLSYMSFYPAFMDRLSMTKQTFLGSHSKMRINAETGWNTFVDSVDVVGNEFTSLMGWATNGVKWEFVEETQGYEMYYRSASRPKSVRTTQQAKAEKAQEEERISGSKIPFASVVFESMYAREDLQTYSEKTMDLLAKNAYSHRFDSHSYLNKESIFDCLILIHRNLDPLSFLNL